MKNLVYVLVSIVFVTLYGQKMPVPVSNTEMLELKQKQSHRISYDFHQKALQCSNDTLHYALAKEQLLAAVPIFYWFDIWQTDNEAISHAFLTNGASVTISGVEFYARRNSSAGNPATVTVRAAIYNVDASLRPTTELVSGTLNLTGTAAGWRIINFTNPIQVNNNFAIVLEVTTTNGIADFIINNVSDSTIEENLVYFRSTYYQSSAGSGFQLIHTFNFGGNTYDFEPIVAPIVTYDLNTDFTATPNPACLGSTINFANASQPMQLIDNRMFTFTKFLSYWGLEPDSTFVYDPFGNLSEQLWQENASYQYTNHGTYNARFFVLGGFFNSCLDQAQKSITVHALPTVSLVLNPNTVAEDDPPFLLSGGSPAGGVYSGPGVIGGTTFDPATAGVGVHEIFYTYTDGNGCSNTASDYMTVDVSTTSIDFNNANIFMIYPNPAHDQAVLYVKLSEQQPVEINITDVQGRLIVQLSAQSNDVIHLPVHLLNAGIYTVRCTTVQNSFSSKLIIQ